MTDFNDPGTGGDRIDLKEVNGALLLFEVHGVEEGIATAYGETSAVRTDVAVLDGPAKGRTYDDTLIFPKILQSQLKGSAGAKVLGRLEQGTAKVGQSPPWQLATATEDDKAAARRYLAYVEGLAAAATAADEAPF